jgi:hypothetical protein
LAVRITRQRQQSQPPTRVRSRKVVAVCVERPREWIVRLRTKRHGLFPRPSPRLKLSLQVGPILLAAEAEYILVRAGLEHEYCHSAQEHAFPREGSSLSAFAAASVYKGTMFRLP